MKKQIKDEEALYKLKDGIIKKIENWTALFVFEDGDKAYMPLGLHAANFKQGNDVSLYSVIDDDVIEATHLFILNNDLYKLLILCGADDNKRMHILSVRPYLKYQ